ncbi:hypothetical protein ACFWBN_26680 [Streptomyces sp. NPDC059989]|uniref:hypothetical protein n=1 Tax=Streptomyces sp. NPDC059989 TaxID=3347026 RepID=UPI0036A931F6
MSGILVVYELSRDDARSVLRVHAVPAAPGTTSVPGPRTFCGKDTFAMQAAPAEPHADPGAPWYAPEHASRICPACDDAVGSG